LSDSETSLLKWVSKSVRTLGSAFSLIVRLAEVCFIKICTIPVRLGSAAMMLSVIKWNPLEKGFRVISA